LPVIKFTTISESKLRFNNLIFIFGLMTNKILFLSLLSIACLKSFAQDTDKSKLVQLSGVVVTGDSLSPVPYTSMMIKNSYRGTVSDFFGFFSLVAQKGDVIEFSALGFKKATYYIPDSLPDNRYSLIQILVGDTITLKQAVIYPWPSREQFKQAFIDLKIPDNDLAHAQRNLSLEDMREEMNRMEMDGSMNYKYAVQQHQNKLYYAGQLPPNNLLNPIAWAQFIQAWKRGDFKRKDKDDE
jgi:hypothetical protein